MNRSGWEAMDGGVNAVKPGQSLVRCDLYALPDECVACYFDYHHCAVEVDNGQSVGAGINLVDGVRPDSLAGLHCLQRH